MALSEAGGPLADAVAPVGYAVRGGPLAQDLYQYKSDRVDPATAARAAARLAGSLRGFLAEQGPALWRAAGMLAGPAAAAVVPSGQGRQGAHPLADIVQSCTGLPVVRLSVRPAEVHARGVNARWVRVASPVAGADVLVVDDTWVSGGSAQSVAAALKRSGARRVAIVVLGRHVNPADPRAGKFLAALPPAGIRPPMKIRQGPEPPGGIAPSPLAGRPKRGLPVRPRSPWRGSSPSGGF